MSRFPGCLSVAVVLPAVLLSAPRSSLADPAEFNPDARIAMDMHEASPSISCESQRYAYGSCEDVTLALPGTGQFDAVVVVYNFTTTTGVQYKVRWPDDWTITSFTSCSDYFLGGDIGQNPMEVYQVWATPIPSPGGTGGIPVGIIRGYAPTPGALEIVDPDDSFPLLIIDATYHEDEMTAWFDGHVGEPAPVGPCAAVPVVDFEVINPVGPVPLEVRFIDRSAPMPETWYWEFGDGASSTEQSPIHVYTAPDTYSVYLRIGTTYSLDDTLSENLVEAENWLLADFDATNPEGTAPLLVSFTDRSVPTPTRWLWTFGDGQTSTEQNPDHLYTSCDTFSVRLHVETEYSADDTLRPDLVKAACSGSGVVADFDVVNPAGYVPLDVSFVDRSTPTPTSWLWDFGDGRTSTQQNPTHRYTACDTYSVYLRVRTETAMDDTLRRDVVLAACDTVPPLPLCGVFSGRVRDPVFTPPVLSNLGGTEPPVFAGHVLSEPTGGFRGLYAPSEADDATFRALLAAASGGTWDYIDARVSTPSVSTLSSYDCVLVWANYAFLDNVAFGNNLADYVDRGGDVVLGAFCAYTSGNFLSGRIMNDPAYCPVVGGLNKFAYSTWFGDHQTSCVHSGVTAYGATYRDCLELRQGANLEGTYADGNISQAVNGARNVRYANGAGGFPLDGQTPAWARIVANSCACSGATRTERSSWGAVKILYR